MTNLKRKFLLTSLILLGGCAYFNTFYNAKEYYREGMKLVTNDTLPIQSEVFDKAIEKSTIVIVKHPDCRWVPEAFFLMGSSYYYKGEYKHALEALDLLCLHYPDSKFRTDALYYKGLAYFKQQKYGEAIVALNELLDSRKYKDRANLILCYIYYKSKNYNALIATTENLLQRSLKSTQKREMLGILGEAQFNLKLYSDALATYTKILEKSKTDEEKKNFKLKIAQIYLEMKDYTECQKFLTDESSPEFKNLLADLYQKLGETEKAKEVYRDVAEQDQAQFSSLAFYRLGQIFEDEALLDSATAFYDSSASRAPKGEYGTAAKKRSEILKRIMNYSGSEEEKDRVQFLLAETYFVDLGDVQKAVAEYQKVYTNFPESQWAPKALYAQFWITKNVLHNDSLSAALATTLIAKYPDTGYTESARTILKHK